MFDTRSSGSKETLEKVRPGMAKLMTDDKKRTSLKRDMLTVTTWTTDNYYNDLASFDQSKLEIVAESLTDIPTVASLKILGYPRFGYLPRSCQTSKNGFQSM